MAKDIALNEQFDIFIDDRNDLASVEGRQEVEQSVALQVSLYYMEEIGSTDISNAKDRIELKAERIARENDRLEDLVDVVVEEVGTEHNKFEVTLIYDQNDNSSFEVP